jgi:hypothetical protein
LDFGLLILGFAWNLDFGIWILFGVCPPQADWNLEFAPKKCLAFKDRVELEWSTNPREVMGRPNER